MNSVRTIDGNNKWLLPEEQIYMGSEQNVIEIQYRLGNC